MEDPTYFEKFQAAQRRIFELENGLTRGKPNSPAFEAETRTTTDPRRPNTSTDPEMLQGTDFTNTFSFTAPSLQQQLEGIQNALLELRSMVQGINGRLTKVENQIVDMDTAKRTLVGKMMIQEDGSSELRQTNDAHAQELKRIKSAVFCIGKKVLQAETDGKGSALPAASRMTTTAAQKRKRDEDSSDGSEIILPPPQKPAAKRPAKKAETASTAKAGGTKGKKKTQVPPTKAMLQAMEGEAEDDARDALKKATGRR